MKRVLILLCLLLVALSAISLAEEINTEGMTDAEIVDFLKQIIISQLPELKDQFNSNPDSLPGPLKSLLGNERINVYFEGEYIVGVVMAKGKIDTIQSSEVENPTLKVTILDQAIIDNSNDSFDIGTALKNKDITYQGVGFYNKMKFF